VIATLGAALACGTSMTDAALLANHAAGIVVGKVGTATATITEILDSIE
jgi:bifunctional ADP-heptose synthase (sugar kinase/adenylyltransferase)